MPGVSNQAPAQNSVFNVLDRADTDRIGLHGNRVTAQKAPGNWLAKAISCLTRSTQATENKAVARQFVAEIRQAYGREMADLASAELGDQLNKGSALTVGRAKTVLGHATAKQTIDVARNDHQQVHVFKPDLPAPGFPEKPARPAPRPPEVLMAEAAKTRDEIKFGKTIETPLDSVFVDAMNKEAAKPNSAAMEKLNSGRPIPQEFKKDFDRGLVNITMPDGSPAFDNTDWETLNGAQRDLRYEAGLTKLSQLFGSDEKSHEFLRTAHQGAAGVILTAQMNAPEHNPFKLPDGQGVIAQHGGATAALDISLKADENGAISSHVHYQMNNIHLLSNNQTGESLTTDPKKTRLSVDFDMSFQGMNGAFSVTGNPVAKTSLSQTNLDPEKVATALQQSTPFKTDDTISPEQAQNLLGQVANARREIALIFASDGKSYPMTGAQFLMEANTLSDVEVLNKMETRTNEMAAHELPPEKMKQVNGLRHLISENLRILNLAAETASPVIKVFEDANDLGGYSRADIRTLALNQLDDSLDKITPKHTAGRFLKTTLQGDEASRFKHQLAWGFGQLLKENPDLRITLGDKAVFATRDERDEYLNAFVSRQPLGQADKDELRGMLLIELNKTLPSEASVTLGDRLGKGANGEVFAGKFNDRDVVVKRMMSDTEVDALALIHEMSLQGRVHDDPDIPKLVGIYHAHGRAHVVMERVRGGEAGKFFDRHAANLPHGSPERAKVALHFVAGTLPGLQSLSQSGYIHRDIKPANILFDENTLQPKLIDFGEAGPSGTTIGNGTPPFSSPEHFNNGGIDITPQADVFSLGSSLYAMMGGKLFPDAVKPWDITNNLQSATPVPGKFEDPTIWTPDMAPVKNLVMACWEKDPANRPTVEQLLRASRGEPVVAAKAGETGLKDEMLYTLDVLKPENPLRQNPEGVIQGLLHPGAVAQ